MIGADPRVVQGPDVADCAAAVEVLEGNLQGLVRNEAVEPHWLGDAGRFWYRRDGDDGPEFVVVTAEGDKSPAFDHAELARALGEALGDEAAAGGPLAALTQVRLSDDLGQLRANVGARSVACDLRSLQCRATEAPPSELLASPDGRWTAFTRDDNLFLLELATGAERALTEDGTPLQAWSRSPDTISSLTSRRQPGRKAAPFETSWSPDGRYLIAPRVDERNVGLNPLVEWVPADGSRRPIVHALRQALSGDGEGVVTGHFLFEIETGRRLAIELPAGHQRSPFDALVLGWSRSRAQAFLYAETPGAKTATVFRLELASGALSQVLVQCSATRVEANTLQYSRPNIRLLGDGTEIVCYGDHSGWGHLDLYDAQTGALKNAITGGAWLVLDIHAVEEGRREIYFSAVGREAGRDPYFRHLYRGSLDAPDAVTLLTEPDADHHLQPEMAAYFRMPTREPLIAPDASVFVDTWSRVDQPPVSVLRCTRDGRVVAELERADASRLYATGWTPPVRERVKADDGETDLYAVYFAPHGGGEGIKHPVIDAAYAGPQVAVAPRNFVQACGAAPLGKAALARLGFAVVVVDARGTPMRSAAFRDAGYVEFTRVAVQDHVAAIRELAQRHREMDLERVGVYGWSWGGTFAAQAILSRPEFYKVAVSGAGVYDYAAMSSGFECMTGAPVYRDGTAHRGQPDEAPANWNKLDVTRLADRLAGRLLIAYADLDENVPPLQAFRLVEALTRANKPYDLLCLPNRNHTTGALDGYLTKRIWDYFIEHLAGTPPVRDFKVELRPPR